MQVLYVTQWRCTQQAALLTAEWGGTLIAHAKRRRGCIYTFGKHQPPCFVQPQPFLVLQGAHGSYCLEMMVEGQRAHMDLRCQVIEYPVEKSGELPDPRPARPLPGGFAHGKGPSPGRSFLENGFGKKLLCGARQ